MSERYHIAEWFGRPFRRLKPSQRRESAAAALGKIASPPCPFQEGTPVCGKKGGVCSIRVGDKSPVITCPRRFDEKLLIPNWLAEIVGFSETYLAREVAFMRSPTTRRPAGRIDLIVAKDTAASQWYGLEVQAVYFSGQGMEADFKALLVSDDPTPPQPAAARRPDWRSSSAKRLMPQLEIKGPTLRRWGTKLAVAVDMPFFENVGGPSKNPSRDLNEGDIIWLVPYITDEYKLTRHHWEVLSLERSSERLLSAETVKRGDFERVLRAKLRQVR